MGKKLVAIFVSHLNSFIMNQNSTSVYQILNSGSGQILQPRQLYRSPVPIAIGMAKIAPWCLARRDNLAAKVPGFVSAAGATTAFCSYPLAVCVLNRLLRT
jgi:hypothetical protein